MYACMCIYIHVYIYVYILYIYHLACTIRHNKMNLSTKGIYHF